MHSKRNHQQNEKTTYELEKIFANDMTDKGLISKVYKQLIKLNVQKQTTATTTKTDTKWAEDLKRHFS